MKEVDFPSHYGKVGALIDEIKGVIVSWRDCDRLSNTKALTIIEKSEEVIGSLFRYVIREGLEIIFEAYEYNKSHNSYNKISSKTILPNDPLFLMNNTVISRLLQDESNGANGLFAENDPATYYKKYSRGVDKCLPTSEEIIDHTYDFTFHWKGRNYKFGITTSVAKEDIQKPGIREGGKTKVGQFYAKKKCISFVRAGREISSDNYGFYKETEARNRWWSIEVRFDADSDDLLGVHNNKQGIEFIKTTEHDPTEPWEPTYSPLQKAREELWNILTNKIEKARKAAWTEVLKTHKKWEEKAVFGGDDGGSVLPEGTPTTTQTFIDVDGERPGFDVAQKKALLERLKEKYPEISNEDIIRAIEKYDRTKTRGCVLYNKSDSSALWSITNVFGFLIILINTRHAFYENIMLPLKTNKQELALAAIELFISSLAWEEDKHFSSGSEKNTIESFRSYVGLHLDRYIKNINLESVIIEEDAEPDEK